MIDGCEKRNRQLAFELQNSHILSIFFFFFIILKFMISIIQYTILRNKERRYKTKIKGTDKIQRCKLYLVCSPNAHTQCWYQSSHFITESALRTNVILCICANCAWALFLFTLRLYREFIFKNSRKFAIPEQGFVEKFGGVWRERAICFLAFPQEQFLFAGALYMRIELVWDILLY